MDQQDAANHGTDQVAPTAAGISLPEDRPITQAELEDLKQMVDTVCTKILGPDWQKPLERRRG
jgi:hypothetical protein